MTEEPTFWGLMEVILLLAEVFIPPALFIIALYFFTKEKK